MDALNLVLVLLAAAALGIALFALRQSRRPALPPPEDHPAAAAATAGWSSGGGSAGRRD